MRYSDYGIGVDVTDDWRNFPNRDYTIDPADDSAESRARFSPPTMTTTMTTTPPRCRRVSLNAAIHHPFFPPKVSHARLNLNPSGVKDSGMRASTCCFRPRGRLPQILQIFSRKRVATVSCVSYFNYFSLRGSILRVFKAELQISSFQVLARLWSEYIAYRYSSVRRTCSVMILRESFAELL